MLCCKKEKKNRGLMALAEGSLAFVRANTLVLEKTEKDLEQEIERENRAPPTTTVGKVRHEGEKLLHSKHVLLAIVLLNVLDCVLVLGELILDIYYLKGVLEKSENLGLTFVKDMKTNYPTDLSYLQDTDVEILYSQLLTAHIEWGHGSDLNSHHGSGTSSTTLKQPIHHHSTVTLSTDTVTGSNLANTTEGDGVSNYTTNSENSDTGRRKRAAVSDTDHHGENVGSDVNTTHLSNGTDHGHHDEHHEHAHTIEEELAHAFHKASITILAILATETLFKVFCYGKHFFENKLEVFDGIIVIGSFIVDLVFLKGLSGYKIQEFVIILAFLVPWRVIRVVNSLVVAVIDHEHFRMKLMYKQKKEIANDLKVVKNEKKNLEKCIQTLKKLAMSAGLAETKINQHLALLHQQIKPKKKFTLSSSNGDIKKKEKRNSLSSNISNDSSVALFKKGSSVVVDIPKTKDNDEDNKI